MDLGSRDRSLPRVNGTTQKEHMLSHPLIIVTNAEIPPWSKRIGDMSAYVYYLESNTLTAFCPVPTSSIKWGRSR